MTVVTWLIVGFIILSTLESVSSVGKPRQALTGGVAAVVVVVNALLVVGVLYVAGWLS